MFARTGTVLISRPTIESAPATSAGRPETAVPNTTSCWPVSSISTCAHAACSTVLTVVWQRARQLARAPGWSPRAAGTSRRPAAPARPGSAGPTSVGVSNPSSTSRPRRAGGLEVSIGQPDDEPAIGRRRGQPLPVIAGEDLLQQDRQRPAVQHDVVVGQHEPVPVLRRCGSAPPGRPALGRGRRPRRARRRTSARSAPRHRTPASSSTYRQAARDRRG